MSNPFAGLEKSRDSSWWSWNEALPGTQLAGTITQMWVERPPFDDSEECPHLTVETATGPVNVRCSQSYVRNRLIEAAEANPPAVNVGDYISITFQGMAGKAKKFDVQITPGNAPAPAPQAPAPAPAAAPAGAPVPPAVAPPQAAPQPPAAGQAPPSLT